jgi:hypothetical protein
MAFYSGTKTNQNLVFGNKGEIGNSSFTHSEISDANITTTENKILASDGAAGDQFGLSVAVGNGRIVVGAYTDNVGANNDQGSAYIFDLDGTQLAKITASDGAANDQFGYSVAVGNGRIVVGSSNDIMGNPGQGSAYIFDLDGTQLAKITASDGAAADSFGRSVAIGNGRIVVGAWNDDDNGSNSGSVYIFDLDGTQLAKITESDGAADNFFGESVAVGNGRIVVVTRLDAYSSASGSAYIFDLDGTQLAKITASDGSLFGRSVAVGNGRIVVGAWTDDDNGSNSGSAYIFDLDGTQLAKITASDGAADNFFGASVTIGNGRIVVGAWGDNTSQGSAYIFDLEGTQLAKITASDGDASDYFGYSMAVGNGRIVVGAWGDAYGDDFIKGAAYIYNTNEYYDDYVEKIADDKIGKYTRLTG